MQRDEKYCRIFVKDGLCSITMVYVVIQDQDSFGAVLKLGLTCGDGHIVEETEAANLPSIGMVARRTHKCNAVVGIARHDEIAGKARNAGRKTSLFIASSGAICVRIQITASQT